MRRFYTTYEAAHFLGVSLPTVVNWITARRLRAHKTAGGHRRIAREDLAAFMQRHGMPIPTELADAAPRGKRALVVDEPGVQREAAATELAGAGWSVEQASHGFAAGLALGRTRPELVVVVVTGPDGGETLSLLRTDPECRDVPVIAVGPPDWLARLRAAGCTAVVPRPLLTGAIASAAESLAKATGSAQRVRAGRND
jgi:excisionase family DNA binding protein